MHPTAHEPLPIPSAPVRICSKADPQHLLPNRQNFRNRKPGPNGTFCRAFLSGQGIPYPFTEECRGNHSPCRGSGARSPSVFPRLPNRPSARLACPVGHGLDGIERKQFAPVSFVVRQRRQKPRRLGKRSYVLLCIDPAAFPSFSGQTFHVHTPPPLSCVKPRQKIHPRDTPGAARPRTPRQRE